MPNEIVWYHSDEVGAPVLNNVAGSLIGVLDACLITGFQQQTLTGVTVASGVATATLSGHGYSDQMMVDIAGASPGALNGRQKITVTGANTFTFTTAAGDGAASGSITAKRSPLGWTKPHSGTHLAIYQRTDPTATAMMLRVDDTLATSQYANHARVLMIESASDINTYTFASNNQVGGQYWGRGEAFSASTKPWILVGDGKTFYFFSDMPHASSITYATTGGLNPHMFGDINTYRPGDAYHCLLGGPSESGVSGGNAPSFGMVYGVRLGEAPTSLFRLVIARKYDGIASAIASVGLLFPGITSPAIGFHGGAYPSPVDNGFVMQKEVLVVENSSTFGHPIRGKSRGLIAPLTSVRNALHRQVLTNITGHAGSVLFVATAYTNGAAGCLAFDLTGPWG